LPALNNVIEGAVISFVDITRNCHGARKENRTRTAASPWWCTMHRPAITVQDYQQILAGAGDAPVAGAGAAQPPDVTERIPQVGEARAEAIARLSRADVSTALHPTKGSSQSGALRPMCQSHPPPYSTGSAGLLPSTASSQECTHDHAAAAQR
jgi:hypothetical protein